MASIEQWQARIHCIHMKHAALHLAEPVSNKSDEHHVIGQSQNFPEELTRFVQTNLGDPATRVSPLPILACWTTELMGTCPGFRFQAQGSYSASYHSHPPRI
jgi:hypothetical protein